MRENREQDGMVDTFVRDRVVIEHFVSGVGNPSCEIRIFPTPSFTYFEDHMDRSYKFWVSSRIEKGVRECLLYMNMDA